MGLHRKVMEALQTVKDPEIFTVSILDLGMVEEVTVQDGVVAVRLLPTFLGCPALGIIEKNIIQAVGSIDGVAEVKVEFLKAPPWTSDRITEAGRQGLKKFGIAPPPGRVDEEGNFYVECPYCGSTHNAMENLFGPTACRSIFYCRNCKNPFEAMKPVLPV